MTRYRVTLEYDGAPFVGWQRQATGPSVQQALEDAIRRFCGETVTVYGAGRTDAGVHALGQVAHFDIERPTEAETIRQAINFHLKPAPVSILACEAAPPEFDARRSARERAYLYRIVNRRSPPALERGRTWFVAGELDADAMHAAAQRLIGRHDFSSFRAARCQAASPVKTLDSLAVERRGEEIRVRARARSFLHNQVRITVGTLRWVGEGKWSGEDVAAALAACDRRAAGPTAPPHGLYLTEVSY